MGGMKHYGWGVVTKDGFPFTDIVKKNKKEAERALVDLQQSIYGRAAPFRVVELFYKDEQS